MAAQAGLCLTWSETPEDTFCRVVAQMERLRLEHEERIRIGKSKTEE